MPRKTLARSLVVLVALVSSVVFAAEAQTFEATGRAPISAGDRVRARQRAFDEALQHTIEVAVGALLGPEALTRRAAELRLKILPRAKAYVTTYRVLEEGELEPGVFVVRVSAEVAADRLLRELADKPRGQLPAAPSATARLALCIVVDPASSPPTRFDAALRAALVARGTEVAPTAPCDPEAMGPIARAVGARAGLVAHITAGRSEPVRGTSLVGREAKLSLRLIELDGRRSTEGRGEAAAYGKTADEATDEAAVFALQEALPAIEAALGGGATLSGKTGGVNARLLGVRRFAQLAAVRTAIERVPGVEAVEPRRFTPGLPGVIELSVRTSQSARALADALARVATSYQFSVREADGQLSLEMLDPLDPGAAPGEKPGPAQ